MRLQFISKPSAGDLILPANHENTNQESQAEGNVYSIKDVTLATSRLYKSQADFRFSLPTKVRKQSQYVTTLISRMPKKDGPQK